MIQIRPMLPQDILPARLIWEQTTESRYQGDIDSHAELQVVLLQNPPLSQVAVDSSGTVIGFTLAGMDGRRGYLHQISVRPTFRRQGIGRQLAFHTWQAFRQHNIYRIHILFKESNSLALQFWHRLECRERNDTVHIAIRLSQE